VVCGANGALGEVAEGGGCEFVDMQSKESLASGLRRLLTHEARYRDLVAEAQKRKFRTWEDYWKEVMHALGLPVPA
jgi:hypothetical protein